MKQKEVNSLLQPSLDSIGNRQKLCGWKNEGEYWQSDCGEAFQFSTDEGPIKHGWKFCPHCGGVLFEKETDGEPK